MNPYRPSFQDVERLINKGAMKFEKPKPSPGKGWNPGKRPKMFESNNSGLQQGLTSFFGQS